MAETNQFNIEVGVDTKDSIDKLKQLGSTLGDVANSVKSSTSSMSSSFTAMSAKLGSSLKSVGSTMSMGLTAPLALLGTALFKSAAQMEQISVSFEVFTGSAEVAKNMLAQLKDQALKSPMQFQDITKGAQTLLGYGLTAEQVIPITRMLGDISGGNADKFGRLSLAFGQVNASGRLMGQEVRQMINAGFNPLQAISEKTGESMASLTKRMHDGKISVQEVANAFTYATSEGGRFFGNADKQSQTLQGQFNKLQESVTFALAEIGTELANNGGLREFFDSLTNAVTKVKNAFLALSPETQSFILKFGLIVATAGPVLIMFGSLLSAIANISTAVGVLSAEFVGLNISTGGILIGLGLIVTGLFKIAQQADESAKAIDNMKKRAEATNDVWTGPSSITESVVFLRNQLKELESRQAFNVKFNKTGIQDTIDKITQARTALEALEKNIGKPSAIKQFSTTPSGAEDSQTKGEKNKIEKLVQANKDAVAEIAMIWMNSTDKKLAELKLKYEQEIKDYVKYKINYSNITKKYEAEKNKIEVDASRQREANLFKAHRTELEALTAFYKEVEQKERQRQVNASKALFEETEGMKLNYPKFSGDFAKDAFDIDFTNKLKNYGEAFYAATKDFTVNMATGFAEIASTALVGGLSMQDTFKSLGSMILSSLGDYLIKIGTAAIAAGTVGTILKTFFTGGAATVPELGIAGGMAAVAVGSAMKALSGKVSDSMSKTKMPGKSGSTASSVASRASGASYQYGGASYATQSVRLMVDLTGAITATQTGYSINKSLETTLRVTGR